MGLRPTRKLWYRVAFKDTFFSGGADLGVRSKWAHTQVRPYKKLAF